MAIEASGYIDDLNPAWPTRQDFLHEGDDHTRNLKQTLQNSFPDVSGPILFADIMRQLVPPGVMLPYYSDIIPSGWAACDGGTYAWEDGTGNVTVPDLRGRVVIAADSRGGSGFEHGTTGGAYEKSVISTAAGDHTHTGTAAAAGAHSHGAVTGGRALTIAQLPAHNHGGGSHTHTYSRPNSVSGYEPQSAGAWNSSQGNYTSGSSGVIIDTQGSGATHNHAITADSGHTHALSLASAGAHTHSTAVDVTPAFHAITYIFKL